MSDSTVHTDVSPGRDAVVPDSYAVRVTDDHVHVWQYRVTIAEPDGEWYFVEALDRDDDPRLDLEYVTPTSPDEDGYWLYSKSYDCSLECE